MTTRITISAIGRASSISVDRVDYWHRTGNFRPIDNPSRAPNRGRNWTADDVVRLLVMVRLTDAGCDSIVGRSIGDLRGALPGSLLAIQAYTAPLFAGSLATEERHVASIVQRDELAELISAPFSPDALFVVDLDAVRADAAELIEVVQAEEAGRREAALRAAAERVA